MKKILIILMCLLLNLSVPAFAVGDSDMDDAGSLGGIEDNFKYSDTIDTAIARQKNVTDEEFEKTLAKVKAKKKKKKQDRPFKGKSFNEENNGQYLTETAEKNLLLSLPVELNNVDGTDIPIGHYKIVGKKINNDVYLDFYQAYTLVARVPAIETKNDFDEMALNFVKLIPYNEQKVKVIYGSMDFNAYSFINLKQEISDQN